MNAHAIERIDLIGEPSEWLEMIRISISNYFKDQQIDLRIKKSPLKDIDIVKQKDAPRVQYKGKSLEFSRPENFKTDLNSLYQFFGNLKLKKYQHDCSNCGKCRCPK